jgi:hypothetical protein
MFKDYLFGKSETYIHKKVTPENTDLLCRICYDMIDINAKDYYAPCQCKGSSALIHKTCYVELCKVEKICSACLTEYPSTLIKTSASNTTPSVKEVLEGFSIELDRILYEMGSYSEIQKVYNLFTSETDFFAKLSENYLKISDIDTYGLNNHKTIDYVRGGARLPKTRSLVSIEDIDMVPENITHEEYESEIEIDELGINIEVVPYSSRIIVDENDEDTQTYVDEDISKDILNALDKISTTVYDACFYDPTIEIIPRFNYSEYLATDTEDNSNLTIKDFKNILNKYYVDISYHGLNYLAKNPIKVYQLMLINGLYNMIKIIKNLYNIFGPDKINNLFGLLIMESMPYVSYETKAKWNKEIVNEITNNNVESASYLENSVRRLRHWKLDLLGYGLQGMNYLIIFLSLYCTYSGVKYVGSYVF